jgi:hypothetical protein
MRSRRRFWITAEMGGMSECGGDKGALDGHTDEGQVDDLEQPRWDLGTKDDPSVVLVIAMIDNF